MKILAHPGSKNSSNQAQPTPRKGVSFMPETFQEYSNLNLPEISERWAEYSAHGDDETKVLSCYRFPLHLKRNIQKLLGGTDHSIQSGVNALIDEGLDALDSNESKNHLLLARAYLYDPDKEFNDSAFNSVLGYLEDWQFQIPHFQTKTSQRNFRIQPHLSKQLGGVAEKLGLTQSTLAQILIIWGLSRCNGALQGGDEIRATAADFLDGLRTRARLAACLLEAFELDSTEEIRAIIAHTKSIPRR